MSLNRNWPIMSWTLNTWTSILFVYALLVEMMILSDPVSADNGKDFNTAGYPTIAFFTSIVFVGYTLFFSAQKVGYGGFMNDLTWFCLNLFLAFAGLNLIFGPDASAASLATASFPRAAIIGLQLVVQSSLGIFAIYTNSGYAAISYAVFGAFNALCLMGSNLLFNYNQPIWVLNTLECNNYFCAGACDLTNTNPNSPTFCFGQCIFDRCSDSGFLEWLRVVGTVAMVFEMVVVVISLMNYVNSVPVVVGGGAIGRNAPYDSASSGPYNASGTHVEEVPH